MKIYQVGGSVRDQLLGRTPEDRDFVVVGSTAEEMLALGYQQVGADFPVFLHPHTHDEYALARLERKTGAGYHGFSVDTRGVTLEEDLSRRDLTINAMALDKDGTLIDPFGGKDDLASGTLRHVSPAFCEDPVRVLRLARFYARFGALWDVAPETFALCEGMVRAGELDALTPERVWLEFEKGFNERYPHLMLKLLRQLGVFELQSFAEYEGLATADFTWIGQVRHGTTGGVPERFAAALPRTWTSEQAKASRIPSQVREVCQAVHRALEADVWSWACWSTEQQLDLLERLDVMRRPEVFEAMCRTLWVRDWDVGQALLQARAKLLAIRQGEVVAGLKDALAIKAAIRTARLAALVS